MDPRKLPRNAKAVLAGIQQLEDGRVVAKKEIRIYIPTRFAERDLASIGIDTHIVGIYSITVDNAAYGVSLINAMIRIEPTSTMKVSLDEDEYYEFYFEPGATVFSSVDLVKNDILVYKIFDEIVSKGHAPYFLEYDDLGNLLATAKKHAGANIGMNPEVMELIASMVSRNQKNRLEYYRHTIQNRDELKTNPPLFVALRSVSDSATNTTNKLGGSYFEEGLTSALVNPTERVERIEDLLRR